MKEVILTFIFCFITLVWFARKHFSKKAAVQNQNRLICNHTVPKMKEVNKKDATKNPAAEEQPHSTPSNLQVPSAVQNQDFDYDVFLNFRREDAGSEFTSRLHQKLEERGIRVFKDDEDLEKGERINTLIQYIERSNIFIPVLSQRYAESREHMMEIAKIVQCKRLIIPVFYDVVPSDVRNLKGPFGKGFAKHQKKEDAEKVKEWRQALNLVGEISGYDLTYKAIGNKATVNGILKVVLRALSKLPMEVAWYSVGLQSRIDHMMKLLDLNNTNDVRMVGIHGEGGLGKTTISKAVYNELHQRFERSYFLRNVREESTQPNGLASLQARFVKDILKYNESSINDVDYGIYTIKRRLKSKRILLVLDDVDSKEQLNKLAGDRAWFGAGSRIIISTRDERLLDVHGVVLKYKPEELDPDQSLQLFSRHAFESDQPHPDYVELSKSVVEYAGGMPLALEVFGPIFFHLRKEEEWLDRLARLKSVQHEHLSNSLRISYEALNLEEKCIFLDIACCFVGRRTGDPGYMWNRMGFPGVTVNVLLQKSLINVDRYGCFEMHDQIRDMGRNIVQEEALWDPGKCSRLWVESEILAALERPSDYLQVIILECNWDSSESGWKGEVSGEAFAEMHDLRFLCAENVTFKDEVLRFPRRIKILQLRGCNSEALAFEASGLEELVVLELSRGNFSQILWNHEASIGTQLGKTQAKNKMPNLKVLKLHLCTRLAVIPDFRGFPLLEELVLEGCRSLSRIDDSIDQLINLTHLRMRRCTALEHLPDGICDLKNLETLDLFGCEGICELPERLGGLESLKELNLGKTHIKELPDSIGEMSNLWLLKLPHCRGIYELPETLGCLESLQEFDLKWSNVRKLPTSIVQLTRLSELDLSDTQLEELPEDIGKLVSLEKLFLGGTLLKRIPDSIGNLVKLRTLLLSDCSHLEKLPDSVGELMSLEELNFNETPLRVLPGSIGKLRNLRRI